MLLCKRETERDRERQRQRERQRHTERERQRETERDRENPTQLFSCEIFIILRTSSAAVSEFHSGGCVRIVSASK